MKFQEIKVGRIIMENITIKIKVGRLSALSALATCVLSGGEVTSTG